MPTEPTRWERENLGRAVRGFHAAQAGLADDSRADSRGSAMVKNSRLAHSEGPKPPGLAYHAVKSRDFNARWDEECRKAAQANSERPRRLYADFVRAPGRGMGR